MIKNNSPVCSFNEWDPLEEVIVGSVLGAAKMGFEPAINAYYYTDEERIFQLGRIPRMRYWKQRNNWITSQIFL